MIYFFLKKSKITLISSYFIFQTSLFAQQSNPIPTGKVLQCPAIATKKDGTWTITFDQSQFPSSGWAITSIDKNFPSPGTSLTTDQADNISLSVYAYGDNPLPYPGNQEFLSFSPITCTYSYYKSKNSPNNWNVMLKYTGPSINSSRTTMADKNWSEFPDPICVVVGYSNIGGACPIVEEKPS